MGSLGWAPCYWCGWWEYNPYIPDPLTHPLCGWCLQSACKKNMKGQLPMSEQNSKKKAGMDKDAEDTTYV